VTDSMHLGCNSVCGGERNSSNTGCGKEWYTCDEKVFQSALSLWNH